MLKRPALATNPSGELVARSRGTLGVEVWKVSGDESKPLFTLKKFGAVGVSWLSDTRLTIATKDGNVSTWDQVGQEFEEVESQELEIRAMITAFLSDDTHVAIGDAKGRVWLLRDEPKRGTWTIGRVAGHKDSVDTLAFSEDGTKLVSASRDHSVVVWNALLPKIDSLAPSHSEVLEFFSVAFDAVQSAGSMSNESVYPEFERDEYDEDRNTEDDTKDFQFDGVSRQDVLDFFSIAQDSGIRGDVSTALPNVSVEDSGLQEVTPAVDHPEKLDDVGSSIPIAIGEGGEPAMLGFDEIARMDLDGVALSMAFSPDGTKLIAGGMDNGVYLWSLDDDGATLIASEVAHTGWVAAVAFSPDQRRVATGSWDNSIGVFDSASLKPVVSFEFHRDYVVDLKFASNSTLYSASYDGMAAEWNFDDHRLIRLLDAHQDWVEAVHPLNDGRVLTFSSDGTTCLWDADGDEPIWKGSPPGANITLGESPNFDAYVQKTETETSFESGRPSEITSTGERVRVQRPTPSVSSSSLSSDLEASKSAAKESEASIASEPSTPAPESDASVASVVSEAASIGTRDSSASDARSELSIAESSSAEATKSETSEAAEAAKADAEESAVEVPKSEASVAEESVVEVAQSEAVESSVAEVVKSEASSVEESEALVEPSTASKSVTVDEEYAAEIARSELSEVSAATESAGHGFDRSSISELSIVSDADESARDESSELPDVSDADDNQRSAEFSELSIVEDGLESRDTEIGFDVEPTERVPGLSAPNRLPLPNALAGRTSVQVARFQTEADVEIPIPEIGDFDSEIASGTVRSLNQFGIGVPSSKVPQLPKMELPKPKSIPGIGDVDSEIAPAQIENLDAQGVPVSEVVDVHPSEVAQDSEVAQVDSEVREEIPPPVEKTSAAETIEYELDEFDDPIFPDADDALDPSESSVADSTDSGTQAWDFADDDGPRELQPNDVPSEVLDALIEQAAGIDESVHDAWEILAEPSEAENGFKKRIKTAISHAQSDSIVGEYSDVVKAPEELNSPFESEGSEPKVEPKSEVEPKPESEPEVKLEPEVETAPEKESATVTAEQDRDEEELPYSFDGLTFEFTENEHGESSAAVVLQESSAPGSMSTEGNDKVTEERPRTKPRLRQGFGSGRFNAPGIAEVSVPVEIEIEEDTNPGLRASGIFAAAGAPFDRIGTERSTPQIDGRPPTDQPDPVDDYLDPTLFDDEVGTDPSRPGVDERSEEEDFNTTQFAFPAKEVNEIGDENTSERSIRGFSEASPEESEASFVEGVPSGVEVPTGERTRRVDDLVALFSDSEDAERTPGTNEPQMAEESEVVEIPASAIWSARTASESPKMGIVRRKKPVSTEFEPYFTIRTPHEWVYGVALAPNGEMIASCGGDDTLCIWETNGELRHRLRVKEKGLNSVVFSTDSKIVFAAGDDGKIHIWLLPDDPKSKNIKYTTLPGHHVWITNLDISADTKYLVSAGYDGSARVWDLRTGECLHKLSGHTGPVTDVALGTKNYTCGSDGTIKVWNDSWKLVDQFHGFDKLTGICAHGSQLCITAANGDAYAIRSGNLVPLQQHRGEARSTYCRGDGVVATIGEDGLVMLYVPESDAPYTIINAGAPLWSVSFDTKRLVCGGDDGRIHVFRKR